MHLNEGFSMVLLERHADVGLADGRATWEIPTADIPPHLRCLGSRFVVTMHPLRPDADDPVELIRRARRYVIDELPG